jgi:hypothetical protein
MPSDTDGITPRYCWAPADMTPATELPSELLRIIVAPVAARAMIFDEVITILGAVTNWSSYPTGHFCRLACRYTHPGSIIVLPDTTVVELVANGGTPEAMRYIPLGEGRSVGLWPMTFDTTGPPKRPNP